MEKLYLKMSLKEINGHEMKEIHKSFSVGCHMRAVATKCKLHKACRYMWENQTRNSPN